MLDLMHERERMVQRQSVRRGVRDAHVLEAMREGPRETFVPEGLQGFVYDDTPTHRGGTDDIAAYIVAAMIEAAEIRPRRPGARDRLTPRILGST